MYFRKIIFPTFVVVAGIVVIILAAAKGNEVLETVATPLPRPTVIIDAGHGGLTNTID